MKKKENDGTAEAILLVQTILFAVVRQQGLSKEKAEKFIKELMEEMEKGAKSNKSDKEMEKVFKKLFKKYGIDEKNNGA